MPAKGNLMINANKLKLFEFNPMILLPLINVANRLPEAPSDPEKVYVYEGKKYGQPKFRIKVRPATNISPASGEFLFDKDEQTGKITLRSIIEVYRNEPDVYPLPIKNPSVTLEFDSGSKKVKKEMTVTASPLMDSVNILQDLHVQAEIQLDEIKDLLTDLKDPTKMASFQLTAKSELWYQVPKSTGFILNPILINPAILMHTIVTPPKEDSPVIKERPYIFRRRRIVPTPTPTPAATGSNPVEFTDPQKLDLTSIIVNSYTKDDTAVFGPLSDQFEVKDLNWQIVNILKTGVNYTIAYRPTARTDVFYFLPQAFRIKAKEQSGEPKIAINMTAGADDKPELYKINIAITLIPYYNALAKKDLYLELNKITNGLTKFCELRLGGYKSVKFELRPAYAGASAIFTGKIPEAIAVIDPVNGFTLNVECSLESFDYFKREITENEGVIIGDIVFELISGKEGAEQVSEQRIPVELNMRKLAGIPVQVDPDIEQAEDKVNIKGFTIFNQNTFPITVGGVDLTLLSDIENTIYDADYDIKVQNGTAISLASTAAQQVLLDSQSIDNDDERIWTQLVCEPYSVNINSDPGAILDRVIDYATGDPQVWNLEISCPLLERWGDLDEATLAPYKQISNIMVEIKNEQGAIFSVKLDKTKPVAKLGMARSITEILKSQQLSGRRYQYRVGTAYIIDPTHWTDWRDPESTASDYLSIIPQKLSVQ